jgi:serine/threonine protein kinase
MELMNDGTLYDYLGSVKKQGESSSRMAADDGPVGVPGTKIRSILFQTLLGVQFIHSRGYMHRDIKPENILFDGETVKVGDYSLARKSSGRRQLSSRRRNNNDDDDDDDDVTSTIMTNYVATRWYRAPELLRSDNTTYTNAIDMFAIGCVAAEIYRMEPLLQGTNNQNQLELILDLLSNGNPKSSLSTAIPLANKHAVDFIDKLLRIDPSQRWTAEEALQQDFYFRPQIGPTKTENQASSFSPVPSIDDHDDIASFTTPMAKLNTGTVFDTFSRNNKQASRANGKRPYVTISPKARPGMDTMTPSIRSKRTNRKFLYDDLDQEYNDAARAFLYPH